MNMRLDLPFGWGEATLQLPGKHEELEGCCSYDHTGHRLVWRSDLPSRIACDLEHLSRSATEMARLCNASADNFLRRWVVTEVLAKLFDVPILMWLKNQGLAHAETTQMLDFRYTVASITVYEHHSTGHVAAFGVLNPNQGSNAGTSVGSDVTGLFSLHANTAVKVRGKSFRDTRRLFKSLASGEGRRAFRAM